jgi:AcrR family transcriptional regulator
MPRRDEPLQAELRERILDTLRALLDERSFDVLSVADIIAAAGVSRASFYFYFQSKQAALAELVRRAVGQGHAAAKPWTSSATSLGPAPQADVETSGATNPGPAPQADVDPSGATNPGPAPRADTETSSDAEPRAALRAGIEAGADLWLANAGVLRAIVESWPADPHLRQLWLAQMDTFTEATVERIQADPAVTARLRGVDIEALAASLTWLGERLYYLAAARVPPFDDRSVLVATLERVWTSTLYGVELNAPDRRQSNRGV